jgi:hypothetical protein
MAVQLDPTPFESDLDPVVKSNSAALGREGNTPAAILDQKHSRECFLGVIMLSTVQKLYCYSVIHGIMCLCLQ